MIDALLKYAKQHGLGRPGFAPKTAKWAIQCNGKGDYLGVVELGNTGNKKNSGKEFSICPETPGMNSGGKSHLFVETAETILFHTKSMEKPEEARTEAEKKREKSVLGKHRFFIDSLKELTPLIPETSWFADLLQDEKTRQKIFEDLTTIKAKLTDKLTLMVPNRDIPFLVEDPVWHDWWVEYREKKLLGGANDSEKKKKTDLMRCFATGKLVEPAQTHDKITELASVGASSMGASLISFDKDAFCSYSFKKSLNAAMSEESASAYRSAMNQILSEQSYRLASIKVGYWFDRPVPVEDDGFALLMKGSNHDESTGKATEETQKRDALGDARKLLHSLRSGDYPDPDSLKRNRYYAMTVSGNGGRVMVRDWMTGSFEEMLENVLAWFDDLSIIHRSGDGLAPAPKFMAVLGSLVRDLKDVPSPLATSLWKAALHRDPIPRAALSLALDRFRIQLIKEEPPRHSQVGLMKAYHLRKRSPLNQTEGDISMTAYLNEEHSNAAYHCGRLMAILADLQYAALGDVGAGIVQRYYAAASSTPALVLGRLVSLSQHHLGKLHKEKAGLAVFLDQKIAEIYSKIENDIPKTLTLEEQSLFALGYYQQKAAPKKKQESSQEEAA